MHFILLGNGRRKVCPKKTIKAHRVIDSSPSPQRFHFLSLENLCGGCVHLINKHLRGKSLIMEKNPSLQKAFLLNTGFLIKRVLSMGQKGGLGWGSGLSG